MTIYYVGPGGDDGNNGTTWALRKLTLNGAEDIPLSAGDTVYVGPGTYRETLTVDQSGSSGQPITYIGDVTGEHTDGVGGVVRITGSDNDQTGTRSTCIWAPGTRAYRIFRGFWLDSGTAAGFSVTGDSGSWTIEDCVFGGFEGSGVYALYLEVNTPTNWTIRRCTFIGMYGAVYFTYSSDVTASNAIVENCLFMGCIYGVYCNNVDSVLIQNCTFIGGYYGVRANSLALTTYIIVQNCIAVGLTYGLAGSAAGEIHEDYNCLSANSNNTANCTSGGNSVAYVPHFLLPLLLSSMLFPPPQPGALAPWSQLKAFVGADERIHDLYGVPRPATAIKNSLGPVQYQPVEREASITHNSSPASIELSDAGRVQFRIPVTNTSTIISVYVYREANYAGTLPQMVIKQPGQSDRTTTDTGLPGQWNQLSDTFTPAATPGYVIVELVSNNTAASGSYKVYFDDLAVS